MHLVFLNEGIAHVAKQNSALMTLLKTHRIEIYEIPNLLNVDERVSEHVDLGVYTEEDLIIIEPDLYEVIGAKLTEAIGAYSKHTNQIKVIKGSQSLKATYPYDARYNILGIGQKCFHRLDITDDLITKSSTKHFLNVNQGYARCSTLPVGKDAAITSDRGVAKALEEAGVKVLLIKAGHIELEGFDYGFIGGVGGSIGSLMLIAGELKNHPDGEIIQTFIMDRGFQIIELFKGPLMDIGSILSCNLR